MKAEDCKDSPLESVVQPQQDARRAIESDVQPSAKVAWDWKNTAEETPNTGWTCYGEDKSGRIQKMFLGEEDRWWHDWLNKPLQFTPVRWCYEVPGDKRDVASNTK